MKKPLLRSSLVMTGLLLVAVAGCLELAGSPAGPSTTSQPTGTTSGARVDAAQAGEVEKADGSLLQVMDRPISSKQAQVSVVDDPQINAGSAGSGQFIVTTGLLRQANDAQLEAILAHEIAHDDLGHVAKAQAMGAGLNIATVLLDSFCPERTTHRRLSGFGDSGLRENRGVRGGQARSCPPAQNTPQLASRMMVDAMVWLQQTTGGSSGGFFCHPSSHRRQN